MEADCNMDRALVELLEEKKDTYNYFTKECTDVNILKKRVFILDITISTYILESDPDNDAALGRAIREKYASQARINLLVNYTKYT